mmetsp:Transcript_15836/g.32841  ORF Transcript_15836/g.32841 Transcript_15836/m.32841 type:complete len:138 (+) Transcript_15836:344-757(+)
MTFSDNAKTVALVLWMRGTFCPIGVTSSDPHAIFMIRAIPLVACQKVLAMMSSISTCMPCVKTNSVEVTSASAGQTPLLQQFEKQAPRRTATTLVRKLLGANILAALGDSSQISELRASEGNFFQSNSARTAWGPYE